MVEFDPVESLRKKLAGNGGDVVFKAGAGGYPNGSGGNIILEFGVFVPGAAGGPDGRPGCFIFKNEVGAEIVRITADGPRIMQDEPVGGYTAGQLLVKWFRDQIPKS